MVLDFRFNAEKMFFRSPSLSDVLFVEGFLRDSGEVYSRESFVRAMKGRIDSCKANMILDYLESIDHIGFDSLGGIVYIWYPEVVSRFRDRKRIKI